MSPWTELLYRVHAALRGQSSPQAVRFAAERCKFIPREAHGTKAQIYNALKTMAEAWPDEPALREPIAHVASLCELNPITFFDSPKRRRAAASTGSAAAPWWVE